MDNNKDTVTLKDLYNYELPELAKKGSLTNRSFNSSSSPNKIKRNKIRVNSKRLPRDFFNFDTSKMCYQQLINKQTLSPDRSNKAFLNQKQKQQTKDIWLPNFADQMLFGDESVMINDDLQIKRIKSRYSRNIAKNQDQCYSPLSPYGTIGAMTPVPSSGNTQHIMDPVFQMTFSKNMYSSISTSRAYDEINRHGLKRGGSVKQKKPNRSLLKSYQFDKQQITAQLIQRRKLSVDSSIKGYFQLPKIVNK